MNIQVKRLFFVLFSLLFLSVFLLYLFGSQRSFQYSQTPEIAEIHKEFGLPLRLIIPAIDVNALVQQVSVTSEGEMDVPNNITNVAWFKLGPRPGEKGSAVIAGHINDENGEDGVFAKLYKLKEGDIIYIEDMEGTSTTFVVLEKNTYDSTYVDEVFTRSDRSYLNLITCAGVWNNDTKHYTQRLVVFSELSN